MSDIGWEFISNELSYLFYFSDIVGGVKVLGDKREVVG